MTTTPSPRIKITYATLRADNEELHAQFETGRASARAEPRRQAQELRRRGLARRRRARSRSARRSTTTSCSGTFAKGTAADVDDAVAAARAAQPAWAATPLARAARDHHAGPPTSSATG